MIDTWIDFTELWVLPKRFISSIVVFDQECDPELTVEESKQK